MVKVDPIKSKVYNILGKLRVALKLAESLISFLNFACIAIIPRRSFCGKLINVICGLTKLNITKQSAKR